VSSFHFHNNSSLFSTALSLTYHSRLALCFIQLLCQYTSAPCIFCFILIHIQRLPLRSITSKSIPHIITLLPFLNSAHSILYHVHSFFHLSHLNTFTCLLLVTFLSLFLFYYLAIFSLILDLLLLSLLSTSAVFH